MEKELGSDVIKATQTLLGKHVKRPPLSEKLLRKPPFRFLHDIITSVLKTNGFFEGLFEEDELISDKVKDRDSKILFLNKVISVLVLTTGKNVSAKPSKIVAGQEPEKTNELLQCLAYALDKKLNSDEAVKKYKDNPKVPTVTDAKTKEKETKNIKKSSDTKKNPSKTTEKASNKKESAVVNKNEKSKNSETKSKRKEIDLVRNEQPVKKLQNLKTVGKKTSLESVTQQPLNEIPVQERENQNSSIMCKEIEDKEIKAADIVTSNATKAQESSVETMPSAELNTLGSNQEIQEKLNTQHSYTIAENQLNSSLSSQDLAGVENDKVEDNKSMDEITSESQDPINSATYEEPLKSKEEPHESIDFKNPRPVLIPKHDSIESESKSRDFEKNNVHEDAVNHRDKKKPEVIIRPPSVRPSSSRPGAPRLREKIDNIVPENENLILGKVNIITENAQNDEEEDTSVIIVDQHAIGSENKIEDQQEALQLSSNEHGHLVQQILNSQKEFSQIGGKTEIEWQFGAQNSKKASNQEIEQLRFNIQALSRVANPLGKLLDHIQEDVEVMRQELQQWTSVYEEVSRDMMAQKSASEETLVPLQTRIKQLDVDIEEKRDKINDIKIQMHKNTTRIEKLLANGTVQ